MASSAEGPGLVGSPQRGGRMLHGFGWSTAFLIVTRASAVAAVPIVLHGLGAALYAVWVLAGALVMIQSLFDLGVASALVRYVAVAAATGGGRSSIAIIARRALVFYLLLSAVVFVALWFGAAAMVGLVHFLKPSELAPAVVIVRWAAVAFVLTNITLVAASVLQGIDRVGAAYRDQTLGWLLYLPLLLAGMSLGSHAQAVGILSMSVGQGRLSLDRSLWLISRRVIWLGTSVPQRRRVIRLLRVWYAWSRRVRRTWSRLVRRTWSRLVRRTW